MWTINENDCLIPLGTEVSISGSKFLHHFADVMASADAAFNAQLGVKKENNNQAPIEIIIERNDLTEN